MSALFLVGDVRERMAQLPDDYFDFLLCSPPFLALRSYLPPDHPDKAKEIGSEGTPAEFIDVLLELTAEWGRLLAPHGSIAIELGDTYAGSGGAGGDYGEDGLRAGQERFVGSAGRTAEQSRIGVDARDPGRTSRGTGGAGWPPDKSLACIPQLYQVALAYGINPLTGQQSPAGRWRVRNLKPWIRSNPPVGALGDKERPATSYVIVACRARDRWFDLDAVRTAHLEPIRTEVNRKKLAAPERGNGGDSRGHILHTGNAAGAPPRDWWHHVDAVLDAELAARAGKPVAPVGRASGTNTKGSDGKSFRVAERVSESSPIGAQGVHLRRALEHAGILTTLDALDVSPKGYSGSHYAVWPMELVRLLVDEMCPRRVCTTCGEPSRRITERTERYAAAREAIGDFNNRGRDGNGVSGSRSVLSKAAGANITSAENITVGWSDCGHGTWRPGRILDPFVGSGTTLAVATGMGRDATGIDIDERNADLARERVGLFLDIDPGPDREVPA